MNRAVSLFVLLTACATARGEVWGGLEPGPYIAGFEVRNLVDEFRPSLTGDASDGRTLQLSVWYPGHGPTFGPPMRLIDYVALTAAEYAAPGAAVDELSAAATTASLGAFPLEEVADNVLKDVLALAGKAVRGAATAAGTHPLLVVVPGNHDPAWRHFVLAEYLASHGYVVAAFPSASRRVRDAMAMDFGMGPFRDQMQDTAFAVDYMRSEFPSVDPSRTMLFGFSMGGNTGGFNLLRDADLTGFMCLDCGLGSTWGTPYLVEERKRTYPKAVERDLAILHISEGGERNDDSFIDSFTNAAAYHAIVPAARHFNFTSLGGIAAEIPTMQHDRWLAGGDVAREIHDQAVRSVRLFLDAHLRREEATRRTLVEIDASARVHFHRIVASGEDSR